jgi:hypothetical protein
MNTIEELQKKLKSYEDKETIKKEYNRLYKIEYRKKHYTKLNEIRKKKYIDNYDIIREKNRVNYLKKNGGINKNNSIKNMSEEEKKIYKKEKRRQYYLKKKNSLQEK